MLKLSINNYQRKVLDGICDELVDCMAVHTRLEAYFWLNEFSTKTANGTLELGTVGVPESVQPNQISPIFWENQFFVFWGAPKNFFDLSDGFKVIDFKIAIF